MPEDASLDQFASSEATETDSGEAETEDPDSEEAATDEADPEEGEVRTEESEVQTGDADPENGEADPEDASPVEPAVSTYQWSAEGGECADCGASADRLWRGEGQKDGGLVCPECKDW